MVLYRVGQDKKTVGNMWLGFHVGGVAVFHVHKGVRTVARRSQWKRIQNISFAVSQTAPALNYGAHPSYSTALVPSEPQVHH